MVPLQNMPSKIPEYAKPAIKSMKVLAKTKKNSPESKTAAKNFGKRIRTLRRRNVMWAGALAVAVVGGAAAAHRYSNKIPAFPTVTQSVLNAANGAKARLGAAAGSVQTALKAVRNAARTAPARVASTARTTWTHWRNPNAM
jgi:hypothetical protein